MNTMQAVLQEVKKAVSGKDEVLLWILTTILAKGHILLEDIQEYTLVTGIRTNRKDGHILKTGYSGNSKEMYLFSSL